MRRTSVYYGVDVGDTVTIYDAAMEPHEVTVEGIYENYIGMYFMMTPNVYREIFRKEPVDNAFMSKDFSGFNSTKQQLLAT